jgi:RimJ/RimL family protein N-acetyltransferase
MGGKDTRVPFPDHVETERLTLDRPRLEDLSDLQAVIGDPRVGEHQFPARFRTPELTASLLQAALAHWDEHGFGPWIVRLRGELIGRAGLMTSTFEGRECVEAKWFIAPGHWGRGYATEAARAAIDAGFAELGLTEILAWTMTTNLPSQAVMRRLGFEEIGPIERGGLPHVAFALRRS